MRLCILTDDCYTDTNLKNKKNPFYKKIKQIRTPQLPKDINSEWGDYIYVLNLNSMKELQEFARTVGGRIELDFNLDTWVQLGKQAKEMTKAFSKVIDGWIMIDSAYTTEIKLKF